MKLYFPQWVFEEYRKKKIYLYPFGGRRYVAKVRRTNRET